MAGTNAEWLATLKSALYDPEQCLRWFLGLLDPGEAKIEHIFLTLTVDGKVPVAAGGDFMFDLDALEVMGPVFSNLVTANLHLCSWN